MARSRLTDPEFLVSPVGRLSRSALGAALIVAGRTIGGRAGMSLIVVGAVPIVNSALGYLAVGPLVGSDLRGRPRDESASPGQTTTVERRLFGLSPASAPSPPPPRTRKAC